MRHCKDTFKIGRNSSHRRCLIANMLKSLIVFGKVFTTVAKAKRISRDADKIISVSKNDNIHARRQVVAKLMIRKNKLTPKEARRARAGDTSAYNHDRLVLSKLFGDIAPKFKERNGGYTRITKVGRRIGDCADMCLLEFVD